MRAACHFVPVLGNSRPPQASAASESIFEYKHRHWRIIFPVIVLIYNYRIFFRRQCFQVCQKLLLFFKSRIPAAVNAQTHHPSVL